MVNDSTFYTDLFDSIRGALVNPVITLNGQQVSVKSTYNDDTIKNPIIVIEPINKREVFNKFSSNEGVKEANVLIMANAKTTLDADKLNEIIETRLKNYNWQGVEILGINSDYVFNNPSRVKYQSKVVSVDFRRE